VPGSDVIDDHLDRIAGRAIAGRVRHGRAEQIVAVGETVCVVPVLVQFAPPSVDFW